MCQMISREPKAKLPTAAEPPSRDMFRKLEVLEKELESTMHTGQNRWIIPYADLLTLLLGLFLLLFAAKPGLHQSQASPQKLNHQTRISAAKSGESISTKQAKADASQKQLQKHLNDRLKLKGLVIRQQERGLVISLKDSILFAPGSADLSPMAKKTLAQLTEELTVALNARNRPIRVEGHTDNTPITTARYPSNWELSTARATNIVRYLVTSRHFSPEKLSAAGYGEFRPIENNYSIEGKQKNRRVDIVILNDNTAHQEPPALRKSVTQTGAGPE